MWFFNQSLIGKPGPRIEGQAWFNSEALPSRAQETVKKFKLLNIVPDLDGYITLINFWDYNCIHCINELPYLNRWWQLYREHHFLIVGVHTPEFAFSQDADKVESAILRFRLSYPVVSDSQYVTWKRYKNSSWPREVLCDHRGIVRYDYSGEGEHETKEGHIQELLRSVHDRII